LAGGDADVECLAGTADDKSREAVVLCDPPSRGTGESVAGRRLSEPALKILWNGRKRSDEASCAEVLEPEETELTVTDPNVVAVRCLADGLR